MKAVSTPYHLCFEVLGNPLRIDIIKALKKGSKSVNDLVKETGAEQSRLSHSLTALKKCRFVESNREGKKIIYSLRSSFLKELKEKDVFSALERHYTEHGDCCWRSKK